MVCPHCNSETKVANSRLQKRNNQVWRRRQCQKCKAIFTTHEAVDMSDIYFVQVNNTPTPFIREKLLIDVYHALQHYKDPYSASYEVTSTIIKQLSSHPDKPIFLPSQISLETSKVLKRFDRQAWLRYVAEHPTLQA